MRCAMMPLLEELTTDKCPFTDLPEKRRTIYSLTRDEIQHCQWLSPGNSASMITFECGDSKRRSSQLPEFVNRVDT